MSDDIGQCYKILGIKLNCSDEELKSTYRKLAMRWHPDKNLNNKEFSNKKFIEIQNAYDTIRKYREENNFNPFIKTEGIEDVFDFNSNKFWANFFSRTRENYSVKIELEFNQLSDEEYNKLLKILEENGFNIKQASIIRKM